MIAARTLSRFFLFAAMTLGTILGTSAQGGDLKPYTAAAFKDAQNQGKTVVVDFLADWCPTCRKQKPALESALHEKDFASVVAFDANYDDEEKLEKELKIPKQSTLVVFKGKNEIARKVGITQTEDIKTLIRQGL
jgi:thioredoxin 1